MATRKKANAATPMCKRIRRASRIVNSLLWGGLQKHSPEAHVYDVPGGAVKNERELADFMDAMWRSHGCGQYLPIEFLEK